MVAIDLERYILFSQDRLSMADAPLDFPKWQLVYSYYRKWSSQLDFDLLLEKLRGHVRVKRGQNMKPGVGIMDSQSIKWGNERAFSWMDYTRRLCQNYELTFDSAE